MQCVRCEMKQPPAENCRRCGRPPLLCVEILSPEDRLLRMEEKVGEYLAMGVRAVWIIDPKTQIGYQCLGPTMQDWQARPVLAIPGTGVAIRVSDVAADLD